MLVIDELQVIWEEVQDIKKWTDSKRQSEAEVEILTDSVKMLEYFNNKLMHLLIDVHPLENSVAH